MSLAFVEDIIIVENSDRKNECDKVNDEEGAPVFLQLFMVNMKCTKNTW